MDNNKKSKKENERPCLEMDAVQGAVARIVARGAVYEQFGNSYVQFVKAAEKSLSRTGAKSDLAETYGNLEAIGRRNRDDILITEAMVAIKTKYSSMLACFGRK